VPQLYSKLAASQELRKMLNIGRTEDRNDINLNYSFLVPFPLSACPVR
jgi:hypothetical protein